MLHALHIRVVNRPPHRPPADEHADLELLVVEVLFKVDGDSLAVGDRSRRGKGHAPDDVDVLFRLGTFSHLLKFVESR